MTSFRVLRRLAVTLSIVLVAATCGEDSTGPEEEYVGTYILIGANGNDVPTTIYQIGNEREEVLGGTATLNANGTFSVAIQFRLTEGTQVETITDSLAGTYVVSGTLITFTQPGEPIRDGTVAPGVLTVNAEDNREGLLYLVFEN